MDSFLAERYAIPSGVSPAAFYAILNFRAGTIVMDARQRILRIRYPDGVCWHHRLSRGESWEDGCRHMGIL